MDHHTVDLLCFRKVELYICGSHTVIGSPVSIPAFVCCGFGRELSSSFIRGFGTDAGKQIVCQLLLYILVEVYRIGRIDRVDQTVAVNGEVKQEGGVVSHAPVIKVR